MIHSLFNFTTFVGIVMTGWAYAIWLLVVTDHWIVPWCIGPLSTFILVFVLTGIQDWAERKLFGYSRVWET